MISAHHTPGPWHCKPIGHQIHIVSDDLTIGCIAHIDIDCKGIPNANLIIAAPKLLEACRRVFQSGDLDETMEAIVGAAITLATRVELGDGKDAS